MTVITTTFVPCGAKLPIIGLIAKENVVAAFGILFGFAEVAENGEEIWSVLAASMTGAAAYSFLVFNLFCAPCFAAMGLRMQYRYAFTSLGCCFLQGSLVWHDCGSRAYGSVCLVFASPGKTRRYAAYVADDRRKIVKSAGGNYSKQQ